jgi:hypothetical protein
MLIARKSTHGSKQDLHLGLHRASIYMSGGLGCLKPSPGNFYVASFFTGQPPAHEPPGGARLTSSPDFIVGKDSRARRSLAPPFKGARRDKSSGWSLLDPLPQGGEENRRERCCGLLQFGVQTPSPPSGERVGVGQTWASNRRFPLCPPFSPSRVPDFKPNGFKFAAQWLIPVTQHLDALFGEKAVSLFTLAHWSGKPCPPPSNLTVSFATLQQKSSKKMPYAYWRRNLNSLILHSPDPGLCETLDREPIKCK